MSKLTDVLFNLDNHQAGIDSMERIAGMVKETLAKSGIAAKYAADLKERGREIRETLDEELKRLEDNG